MGRHTITHSCGHDETITLSGPRSEQDRKAAWMADRACYDCQRAERNATAAADSAAQGWPSLTGTEKQVAWATTIRAEMIETLLIDSDADVLIQQTEASWWIDHRHETPEVLAWRVQGAPKEPTRAQFVCQLLEALGHRQERGQRARLIIRRFGDPRAFIFRHGVPNPLEALATEELVDGSRLAWTEEQGWLPAQVEGVQRHETRIERLP